MASKPKLKVVAKKSAATDKSAFKGKPKASPKAAMQELLASVSMGELAEANMKEYGTYTIEDRAINCLYDGSKPVVRRVLYAMYGLGLTNSHNYVKAARPVSEAMGKYHPHGDCLDGATKVLLCNGTTKRLDKMVGSEPVMVWAYDHVKNKLVAARAHSFRVGQHATKLYTIHLSNGAKVVCTANHPFYKLDSREWCKAEYLHVGDTLAAGRIFDKEGYQHFTGNFGQTATPLHHVAHEANSKRVVEDGYVRHHKDENPHNNDPSNIVLVSRADHAGAEHDNYKLGLDAGRKAMFETDGALREAVAAKNAALATEVSKHYGLYLGFKGLRYLESVNKKLTEANYENLLITKSAGKIAKLTTIYRKGYTFASFVALYRAGIKLDTTKATGLTAGLREKRKQARATTIDQRTYTRDNSNKAVASVLLAISKAMPLSKATWEDYRRTAANVSPSFSDNACKLDYPFPKIVSRKYGVKTVAALAKAVGAANILTVERISVRTVKTRPMYDFTVDKYENMAISVGNGGDIMFAHNSSIYGAMVRQSNGNGPVVPLVDGQGNWGDYEGKQPTYGAAAYRYTECRLTEFATKYMVAKEYMDERVIPYVPNYDGTEREPIYLPSLLPMAFVNGTFGIAMGVSCHMPAYSLESVVSAISTLFKTKNAKKAARKLVPISRWGAKCLVTQEGLDEYHNTGLGKFVWKAQYTVKETKTGWLVSVTGMPIGNNIGYEALFFGGKDSGEGRKTEKGIANIAGVYRVENLSSREGLLIEIDCRTEEALDKVEKRLTINESYRAMTTLRRRHPTDPERTLTTFLATSPVHMLELWLEWRISLERSLLSSLIENNEAEIKRLSLLITAASNLDKLVVIIKAKSGDKVAMIAKALKVSVEDARVIWGLTVSRLDAVNIVATKERIVALTREIKTYKAEHKDPTLRLVNGLAALASAKGLERALTKNSNVKAKKSG